MHSLKRSINWAPASKCSRLRLVQASSPRRLHLLSRNSKTTTATRLTLSSRQIIEISGQRKAYQSSSSLFAPSAGPVGALKESIDVNECPSEIEVENLLLHSDQFCERHVGPRQQDIDQMLAFLGYESLEKLIDDTVPEDIRFRRDLNLPKAVSEQELIEELKKLAKKNVGAQWKSFIGMGYYDCIVPPAILRNIFENPGWLTAYTAYQAEIAQGRLESLMNYQTMVADLTGLEISNASLLDEATAAAEALQVCSRVDKKKRNKWLVSEHCFPQTLAVVSTRAEALGVEVDYFDERQADIELSDKSFANYSGLLLQNPDDKGFVRDIRGLLSAAKKARCLTVVATDLLACTQIRPPGEMDADLCVGSSQRFGVPLNFGGPHAGFLSCTKNLMRSIPGRIVGLTRDSNGQPAYRFALQTREQHIRRDKATSNICTAQALLANISAMYAVYHGPDGLKRIGASVHQRTSLLAHLIKENSTHSGLNILNDNCFFDTLTIEATEEDTLEKLRLRAKEAKINLRLDAGANMVGVSLDETTKLSDVLRLAQLFNLNENNGLNNPGDKSATSSHSFQIPLEGILVNLKRESKFLTHPIFNSCKSEAQLVRYIKQLENKDVSLAHSMIPLGSCTMKLNATSQLLASSWPEFNQLHPFQPQDQVQGYLQLIDELEKYLCEITGYDRISFQPNSGAQGEYAGLRCIRSYLSSIGQSQRDVCLIPVSAHGTNPASAQMAGFKIKPVRVNMSDGSIDLDDLRGKIEKHRNELGCLMVTYPSTFGVFESEIRRICDMIHEAGGQVYLDGANMNAQVGLCRPGDYGSDVSHLNLHKTFCIPHGGGGPGVGPIGVKAHLAPFLPSHPQMTVEETSTDEKPFGTCSANHWGSPAVLPISWSYVRLMSGSLRRASEIAILNANYMVRRLENDYKILFRGSSGNVAHEFIIDCGEFKKNVNIEAIDIAKRLQDFGLHAPTVSWPLSNSLMLEPTECEDKLELDRYCDALLAIRQEIRDIEEGRLDQVQNPLKQAPHTQMVVCNNEWSRPYSREQAAFPANFLLNAMKQSVKIWPTVGRVDDIYGDTHLFCTCPPVEESCNPEQQ